MLAPRTASVHHTLRWSVGIVALLVAVLAGLGTPFTVSDHHGADPRAAVATGADTACAPEVDRPVVPDHCCSPDVQVCRPAAATFDVVLDVASTGPAVSVASPGPLAGPAHDPGEPPRTLLQVWRC